MQRRLAAILSADVAGYSSLMGHDEAATIQTLTAYRDLVSGLVTRCHGRVVDSPGETICSQSSERRGGRPGRGGDPGGAGRAKRGPARAPAHALPYRATAFDRALAPDDGQADAWALRGMVYLVQQRHEEAVRLQPNFTRAT